MTATMKMANSVLTFAAVGFLSLAASLAAPMSGGFGGSGGSPSIDLGSPQQAPGGFVGRFGKLQRDVMFSGVESEGFRRVGLGADASRLYGASLAGPQTSRVGRPVVISQGFGVQGTDTQLAGPRAFAQLETGYLGVNPRELGIGTQDIVSGASRSLPHMASLRDVSAQETSKKRKLPGHGEAAKVIGTGYASGSFSPAGVPWRNCVSSWDPRCRRTTARPNLWFLF